MRIAVACDHAGFPLKETVIEAVQAAGHQALDLGTDNTLSVDYSDYAKKIGEAINEKRNGVPLDGRAIEIEIDHPEKPQPR